MLFRARELREGATPEDLRRQMNEAFKLIERDLTAALSKAKVSSLVTDATYSAGFGEVVRVAPPSAGTRLILPEPNLAQLDSRITAVQEAATGALSVEVVNGTINGATTLAYLAGIGTVEFVLTSTGWYAWSGSLVASFPLAGLAAQATDTFVGNVTAGSAVPTAAGLSTLAGSSLGFVAHALKYIGATSNINSATTTGDLNVFDISALECGGIVTLQALTEANIDGFTAKPDGFWFILQVRDATTTDYVSLIENSGNTTTSIRTPQIRDWRIGKNDAVMLFYSNLRWRIVDSVPKLWLASSDSVTWAATTSNFARSSRGIANIRVTLTGNQILTGVVPDGVTPNGEILNIENIDTVDTLTISHDATSTAANRFFCPAAANYAQGPLTSTLWRHDATSARWRMMSHS
jgi:hypothetical protein